LRAAAEAQKISYRAAWGLLAEAGELAGAPLVELQRGRGARLTRFGVEFLRRDGELRRAFDPLRVRFEVRPTAAAARPLRIAASHDPLLAAFCERFAMPASLVEGVSFRGSEEALALFSRGAVEVAGFHLEGFDVRRFVQPGRDALVRFAEREQGLILPHGNPRRLASMADIARTHARFVNRQRGSGTRRLVDRLLADAGIAPESVRGYGTEEYTHRAVAATVAAGGADAGFGVHAAAAELGLDFVPVLRERYWLAMRRRALNTPAAQRLLEALDGKPLARMARTFVGYVIEGAGEVVNVADAEEALGA
ncbi:MAG TPA: substrate-binding domain-containing protein, partial [Burkholderiales bacterium]|nr:substrate-binding domain-containing protein [Burkholderiales bacterium]